MRQCDNGHCGNAKMRLLRTYEIVTRMRGHFDDAESTGYKYHLYAELGCCVSRRHLSQRCFDRAPTQTIVSSGNPANSLHEEKPAGGKARRGDQNRLQITPSAGPPSTSKNQPIAA